MKIKWERNSKALDLCGKGLIKYEDIIPRTQTQNFPAGAATVRMRKLSSNPPNVTIHIRGKSKIRTYTYSGGQTFECAETCRVNLGEEQYANGILDEDLSWLDVHNIVEEVKLRMCIQ